MSPSLIAYCTFIRPPTSSASASAVVCRSSAAMVSGESERGGSEQAESPEWMPASSICSMMPAMNTSRPSQSAVDVDLDRVREVAVEEQRVLAEHGVDLPGLVVRIARLDVRRDQARQGAEEVVLELRLVADDRHGAAAEHVGRAHDEGQAEVGGDEPALLDRIGDAVLRLLQAELVEEALEAVAVLGEVDGVGRGAEDRHVRLLRARGRASAASGRRTAR